MRAERLSATLTQARYSPGIRLDTRDSVIRLQDERQPDRRSTASSGGEPRVATVAYRPSSTPSRSRDRSAQLYSGRNARKSCHVINSRSTSMDAHPPCFRRSL